MESYRKNTANNNVLQHLPAPRWWLFEVQATYFKERQPPSFQYDIIKDKPPSMSSETIPTIKSLIFTFPKTAVDLKLCCYCPQSLLLTSRTVRWKMLPLDFFLLLHHGRILQHILWLSVFVFFGRFEVHHLHENGRLVRSASRQLKNESLPSFLSC